MQRIIPMWKSPVEKQEPRYTVDEIMKLAKQFVHEGQLDSLEGVLAIGLFLAWLAKREQGKEKTSGT